MQVSIVANIFIYGDVGEDYWWSDDPITGKSIAQQLKAIPVGDPINLRINSPGGDVGEGLAIYNLIKARSADVTAYIDGYALSAASFIPLAAGKIISPESSVWMLHNPHTISYGDGPAMRAAADMLDTCRDSMLSIYREKTGKTDEELIAVLDAETWMTGKEAADFGLCDETSATAPIENRLPDRFKLRAVDRQKLAAAGWDCKSPRKKAAAKANPKPEIIPMPDPIESPSPNAATVNPDIEARLALVEISNEALRTENVALGQQLAESNRRSAITAQFAGLKEQATKLVSEFKLRPTEFDAMFAGDRATPEALLASTNADNHIFFLVESIATASTRAAGLPTEFQTADPIENREEETEPEGLVNARSAMSNAWKN